MSDLARRLRATPLYEGSGEDSDLGEEAAARIEQLEAQLSAAAKAIRPFAAAWGIATASGLTGIGQLGFLACAETSGLDFMRAHAALTAYHEARK